MKGSSFRSAGARPLGVEGRARQNERLMGGARLFGSTVKGSSSVSVRARPLGVEGRARQNERLMGGARLF